MVGAEETSSAVHLCEGLTVGDWLGPLVGTRDGVLLGVAVGVTVGVRLGMIDGWFDGRIDGVLVGGNVGVCVHEHSMVASKSFCELKMPLGGNPRRYDMLTRP